MFIEKGPGKIDADTRLVSSGVLRAVLYNFDFDDFDGHKFRKLKVEHTKFLAEQIMPLLEDGKGDIWLQGHASQIGAHDWNMTLSMVRAGQVQAYLYDKGITEDQVQADAIGDKFTETHAQDDERDRSVRLWVHPRVPDHPKPPPPPRKVPKPLITRDFKISMVTGLSVSQALAIAKVFKGVKVGRGLEIDGLIFLIWDTENKIACFYVYIGIGIGVSMDFAPKVSATTHGPWTDFQTEKPMPCWRFGRWARFTTAGAGPYSVNWITFETPPGIDNVSSLSIDTGTTLGGGMSTTIGDLIRATQPFRFSGP